MDKKITLTALLISVALSGCSSSYSNKNSNAKSNKSRTTVADVMKQQSGSTDINEYRKDTAKSDSRRSNTRSPTYSSELPLKHYTRSESKELKGIFPRLPNPDLCMYVYPHLSLEGATIPGYSSCFSMYDKNHYALPGEMPATMQHNY